MSSSLRSPRANAPQTSQVCGGPSDTAVLSRDRWLSLCPQPSHLKILPRLPGLCCCDCPSPAPAWLARNPFLSVDAMPPLPGSSPPPTCPRRGPCLSHAPSAERRASVPSARRRETSATPAHPERSGAPAAPAARPSCLAPTPVVRREGMPCCLCVYFLSLSWGWGLGMGKGGQGCFPPLFWVLTSPTADDELSLTGLDHELVLNCRGACSSA